MTSGQHAMSRRALAAAVGGGLPALALAACGRGAAPAGTQPSKPPVTLRYTTFWAQDRLQVLQPAVDEFQRTTGHTVVMESVPDYAEKLVTEFVGGAAADVPQAYNQVMTKLYDQGMVLDLLPFATRDKVNVRRDYGLMGIELWDGKLYAMPYVLSPHAWYYNKTMVKEAGAPDPWDQLHGTLTWEDLLTIAQATTRPASGERPDRWGISLTYNDIEYQLAGFIWSNGGKTHDYGQMRYLLDDPRTIEAVQFVYDLLTKHRVILPLATRDELGKAGVRDVFVAGRVCLVENSSSALNSYLTGIGAQFEWDVFPIPQARKGGPPPVAYTSGDPNCVNAATRHKDEGWSFVRWLAGPQTQGLFGRTKLAYPALLPLQPPPGADHRPGPAQRRLQRREVGRPGDARRRPRGEPGGRVQDQADVPGLSAGPDGRGCGGRWSMPRHGASARRSSSVTGTLSTARTSERGRRPSASRPCSRRSGVPGPTPSPSG
jgi:ABC-type glycerol-3-phosphate transport system substrate-binding protein